MAPVFDLLGTIVERFGWPGAIALFGMYLVERYGTVAQKREIIDLYILGHGLPALWPIAIVSATCIVALLAQKRYYDRKLTSVSKRLDEVASEKGRLQEQLVGKPLRHSDKV
jgi:hypothetical protein